MKRRAVPRPDPAAVLVDALLARPRMAESVRQDHARNRALILARRISQ